MNRLSDQTSPYLLQHADNPVHWYPWGEDALRTAREQDKPILLSIGYSACHWCHVMAHESFEDNQTAALMNELYVNIKVDREERPDLDKIYQNAHSMLTNRPGGWPLTVFLTPDEHMPIFAGTYFPPAPRHGLPSFQQVLEGIQNVWQSRRDEIERQSDSLRDAFRQISDPGRDTGARLTALPIDIAGKQIIQQFDSRHGGFSGAPKFPHPAILKRAMQQWASGQSEADKRALHTALFTLLKMDNGGIFDHIGGGFCRYSTDERWVIPHFEKMLYDNGPLLRLNVIAGLISGDPVYTATAMQTAQWVMREMQSDRGGYYSSLDADSEGEEGKFYVWTPEEVAVHLQGEDLAMFNRRYGLDQPANFEGKWHLHAHADYDEIADEFDIPIEDAEKRLAQMRERLFAEREKRVHPGRDDKILSAWNGLMITGMAAAGRLLQKDEYIESAEQAARFLRQQHWQDGRLLATSKDGHSHLNAYLDDYAFLLEGLLELLEARWNPAWLEWAVELADRILELFEDTGSGGYFFTSHDHEQLIMRNKSYSDEAIPAGSGIAATAIQRLGYLLSEPRYLESAEKCLKAAWSVLNQAAISHCTMLDALQEHLNPPRMIILRGEAESLQEWLAHGRGKYLAATHFFAIDASTELPPQLADKAAGDGVTAYICEGLNCLEPVRSLDAWRTLIDDFECRL